MFVNELALSEACAAASPPHRALERLLLIRKQSDLIRRVLYCAGSMSRTEVRPGLTIAAVAGSMSRDRRSLLLNWVNQKGPFIEADRLAVDDDLFYFGDIEVTELGLGEAARRILATRRAGVLSVIVNAAASRFSESPLRVVQGFLAEPIRQLDVPNYWEASDLEEVLKGKAPTPTNWSDLLDQCRSRYDRLWIGEHCDATLKPRPYTHSVGDGITRLLDILQTVMVEMEEDGSLTPNGRRLLQQHFVGERALFSDESPSRKEANPGRFVFPDPAGHGRLKCFWHGKVSTQFYRLHFEWPVRSPCQRLKVVYIGPHR